MRAIQTTLLGLALLASATVLTLPVQAGCSYVLAQPSGCVTAIYENDKHNAATVLANAGTFGSAVPGFAVACAALPPLAVVLPALPGLDGVSAWQTATNGNLQAFQAGVGASLPTATAGLIANEWSSSIQMGISYLNAPDGVVAALGNPSQLPSPSPPDPTQLAGSLGSLAGNAGTLQSSASASIGCAENPPQP